MGGAGRAEGYAGGCEGTALQGARDRHGHAGGAGKAQDHGLRAGLPSDRGLDRLCEQGYRPDARDRNARTDQGRLSRLNRTLGHALTEPCDLDAIDARALIGGKTVSPVELTASGIRRIEEVDPAVNAMVARDFDGVLAAARQAEAMVMRGEALGALHGLPLGVKDLIDAKGLPTTYGSPVFKGAIAAQDEGAVASLRAAGALILGKTNTPAWGAGGNTRNAVYGATGNPFDPTRSAAGSSGGSAAALACGMVPVAPGSETGGSLRNPASFCGIVGFRPTPGLIPGEKRNMAWIQLSTLGPMARTVPDLALMLSAMVSNDARDPLNIFSGESQAAVSPLRPADLSRLRVAATTDFGFAPTERIVAETFRA